MEHLAHGVHARGREALDVREQRAEALLLLRGHATIRPGDLAEQHHHRADVAEQDALVVGQRFAQVPHEGVEVRIPIPPLEPQPGKKPHEQFLSRWAE